MCDGRAPICLGEGHLKNPSGEGKTYFIVIKSRRLMRIREEIEKSFRSRGGDKKAFVAAKFYPHITVGFTVTDLHFEQGVVKDEKSCWENLRIE